MLIVLGTALALSAEAAATPAAPVPAVDAAPVYGPPAPRKAKPVKAEGAAAAAAAPSRCADVEQRTADDTTIVVCGQSPSDEYRLDRSVMQAEKEARHPPQRPNPPLGQPPREPTLCERSGGCRATEALDWVNAAMVAGRMAAMAARGENPLGVFVTDPQPSEYQRYQTAKSDNEQSAEEAAAEAARARILARAEATKAGASAVKAVPPPFPEARSLVPFVYDTTVDDCVWTMKAGSEPWVRGSIGRGERDPQIDLVDAAFFEWSDAVEHAIELSAGDPNFRLPARALASNAGGQTPGSISIAMDAPLRRLIGGATSLQVWKDGRPVYNARLADTPSAAQLNACVRTSSTGKTDEE